VSRLQSSVDHPLGEATVGSPLCEPFSGEVRTVGIVGNGPLSSTNREAGQQMDVVVRFNLMNNWQRFQEKIGAAPRLPPPLLHKHTQTRSFLSLRGSGSCCYGRSSGMIHLVVVVSSP